MNYLTMWENYNYILVFQYKKHDSLSCYILKRHPLNDVDFFPKKSEKKTLWITLSWIYLPKWT